MGFAHCFFSTWSLFEVYWTWFSYSVYFGVSMFKMHCGALHCVNFCDTKVSLSARDIFPACDVV
jgi:hypothetical protein